MVFCIRFGVHCESHKVPDVSLLWAPLAVNFPGLRTHAAEPWTQKSLNCMFDPILVEKRPVSYLEVSIGQLEFIRIKFQPEPIILDPFWAHS